MLLAALAGANMIYGLGMIDLGMTLDFGQLVVDNEIAKMVRKILYGIPVNEDTLAVDVIRKVGAGGHFLMEEHTLRHMKTTQSQSRLFDRNPRHTWKDKGATDLSTRATEEACNILRTHKPQPLPSGVIPKMQDIIAQFEQEVRAKKK
jgi:trimethylamine---corrinoid protein Co-methyltransferase